MDVVHCIVSQEHELVPKPRRGTSPSSPRHYLPPAAMCRHADAIPEALGMSARRRSLNKLFAVFALQWRTLGLQCWGTSCQSKSKTLLNRESTSSPRFAQPNPQPTYLYITQLYTAYAFSSSLSVANAAGGRRVAPQLCRQTPRSTYPHPHQRTPHLTGRHHDAMEICHRVHCCSGSGLLLSTWVTRIEPGFCYGPLGLGQGAS